MRPSEASARPTCESALRFWPEFVWQTIVKHARLTGVVASLVWSALVIANSSKAKSYTDEALVPVSDDDDEKLDLLTKTTGAAAAVHHIRHVAEIVHSAGHTHGQAAAAR